MASLILSGSTSGSVTLSSPAVSGTTTLTLPTTSGTVLTSASSLTASQLPAGSVLQVLNAYKTDTQSFAPSATFSDIVGLTLTITPTSSSSKFLIYFSVSIGGGADATHGYVRINRNGTVIGQADTASNRTPASGTVVNTSVAGQTIPTTIMYLDSPATASSITYKLTATANNAGATIYLNRSSRDVDASGYDGRGTSSLVVMEVKG
jgi:hypothetical protein